MDIPLAAIKHIPFIILGIWPVNLLTLLARDHSWGWNETPPAVMELWEWGTFVSLSLAILTELGVEMFVALAKRRREREQLQAEIKAARAEALVEGRAEGRAEALVEGRAEGRSEARAEAQAEARAMTQAELRLVLSRLSVATPEQVPDILSEYLELYSKDLYSKYNDAAQD